MNKIILEVEINEEGLLAKMAAVEEARRALNNAIANLENAITGRYNDIKPGAKVIEMHGTEAPGKDEIKGMTINITD